MQYDFAYDAAGRPTTVKIGTQSLSTNTYNANGTLQKVTYGNGGKVTYSYDSYKRVTGLKYDTETTNRYTYTYGANGQTAQVTDNNLGRTAQSEYDTANRPMRVKHMEGSAHVYTGEVEYDGYNNLQTFKEQVGASRTPYQTDFTYDNENKPTLLTYGSTSNKTAYAYDVIGRVSTRTVTAGGYSYASAYGYAAGAYGTGSTTPLIASITQSGETRTNTLAIKFTFRNATAITP